MRYKITTVHIVDIPDEEFEDVDDPIEDIKDYARLCEEVERCDQ